MDELAHVSRQRLSVSAHGLHHLASPSEGGLAWELL
jgi:hypothetical protein